MLSLRFKNYSLQKDTREDWDCVFRDGMSLKLCLGQNLIFPLQLFFDDERRNGEVESLGELKTSAMLSTQGSLRMCVLQVSHFSMSLMAWTIRRSRRDLQSGGGGSVQVTEG